MTKFNNPSVTSEVDTQLRPSCFDCVLRAGHLLASGSVTTRTRHHESCKLLNEIVTVLATDLSEVEARKVTEQWPHHSAHGALQSAVLSGNVPQYGIRCILSLDTLHARYQVICLYQSIWLKDTRT